MTPSSCRYRLFSNRLACEHQAVLVVYALTRLVRDARLALTVERKLRQAGASLAALDMSIDTSTPFGRFSFGIWALQGQLEREIIVERTSDARLRRQAAGQRMSAEAPYGWQLDEAGPRNAQVQPTRLVAQAEEQAGRARLLQLHAEGQGVRAIARKLQAEGFPPRGNGWHHATVGRIIARETAKVCHTVVTPDPKVLP